MLSRRVLVVSICSYFVSACSDDSSKPYLKIIGGGFTNNIASNFVIYSLVAKRMKKLPPGSVIEATFDLPDSPRKFTTFQKTNPALDRYLFESEPLHGLKKDNPLTVKLRLLDGPEGKVLAEFERAFTSNEDQ